MPNLSAFTGVLGPRLAAHLLRRATYVVTKAAIDEFAEKTSAQAVAQLLQFSPILSKPVMPETNTTWVDTVPAPADYHETKLKGYIIGWMIDNMRTDKSLRSKMILFLHQNWIVNNGNLSHYMYDYLKLLEFYSLGSYKTLALKMCRDNKMLIYLNGFQNTRYSPNENFSREFLELFTIGKGPQVAPGNYTNYTEDDIKEAAKLLTGYMTFLDNGNKDPETNIRYCIADPTRHTLGDKVFSDCFRQVSIAGSATVEGMATELSSFIDMVFDQKETARNICRKLYRYFVQRDITPLIETDIIEPLADILKGSDYNLSSALEVLLKSRHFYDLDDENTKDNIIGGIVKSPLELILNTINFFGISPHTEPNATPASIWERFYRNGLQLYILPNAGMPLFETPSVAGFAAYYSSPNWDRNWIDASSIPQRYYLGRCFLENKRLPYSDSMLGASLNIVLWVRNNISAPAVGAIIVDELIDYMFPEKADADRKKYFLNDVLFGSLSQTTWEFAWNSYINTGALDVVKPRLELLFNAIIYSHEYQLQ